MRKAVGIIPARYGSTRFPGKALAEIAGRPMVVWVYRRAAQAASLDEVIVATDDERILEAVVRDGGKAVMTAPTHTSGTERLAEAATALDADLVVNVQGDEPLLDPAMIDQIVAAMRENPAVVMATLCRPFPEGRALGDSNVVKVVTDRRGFALYFSRAPIPYPRHPEFQQVRAHIGIYGYAREFLLEYPALPVGPLERCESLEQLRALENGFPILVVPYGGGRPGLSVDTPEDLEAVRRIAAAEKPPPDA